MTPVPVPDAYAESMRLDFGECEVQLMLNEAERKRFLAHQSEIVKELLSKFRWTSTEVAVFLDISPVQVKGLVES